MTDVAFDEKLAQWRAWCEAPWGRLRFAVVRETLRRQTEALGTPGATLRILDVGGGDGRDAVPLAGVAGRVRTIEGSIDDLSAAGDGYDLVLCHFVLHYRPAHCGDLERLAATLRPGGRLSVMAPNPASRVILRLTREGPQAALDELAADDLSVATFATTARKVSAEEVEEQLRASGMAVVGRYAARVVNDYVADDRLKDDPAYFAALERLELALCDQEPFLRLGAMWQLVGERSSV